MAILFVCSRETDYLQDLTYAGLAETLGRDQILDYPFHWQYHKNKRHFFSKTAEYPGNLGFVEGRPGKPWDEKSVERSLNAGNFRLVILASVKPDALNTFARLFGTVRVPWIFIDGGDWPEIGGDFRRTGGQVGWDLFRSVSSKSAPALIFKRELTADLKEKAFPLPFSVQTSQVPILQFNPIKKSQVLFRAVESSPVRKQVFKMLEGKYDCRQNGSVAGQKFRRYNLKGADYFNALNQARIALSFRGEGFDTLRFWEIPACGTLLLSEKPTIELPHPFVNKEHAVFCRNDAADLLELTDYYLKNEKEAEEIAQNGQKHLLTYHTHIKRAEYILDVIETRLRIVCRGDPCGRPPP